MELPKNKSRSQMHEVMNRLLKNPLAICGIVFIILLVLVAISGDLLFDYHDVVIKTNIADRLQRPSAAHILGTDDMGRDVLARLVYATRYSLLLSFMGNLLGLIVGSILGVVSGMSGKTVDTIIMRFVDILLAIPATLFSIAIVAAFGCTIPNIIIALSVCSIPIYARIMRSAVLSVSDMEYIEAARAIGARTGKIVFGHILPNCLSSIIINITLNMATLIMATSVLSFLGLGIPAPTPEWGSMLSEGRTYIREFSYLTLYPGLAITITIIAFNLAGDGLRDAFDPKLKYSLTTKERFKAMFRKMIREKKMELESKRAKQNQENILEISDLTVEYRTDAGTVHALNGLDLSIGYGKVLGLVGETGAGKTTTALSVMKLIQSPPGRTVSGSIMLDGREIRKQSAGDMSLIRGKTVSMIFQDPMTALNPVQTVEQQIAEVIEHHEQCSSAQALKRAGDMLELIGIQRERGKDYPHQFSGGMKQRVVIAIALACNPKLLIADEPTTALDVTIQAQILEKMKSLQSQYGTSLLMITHDLGIVAETCDSVAIIYAGSVVEYGTVADIFTSTRHPYTEGLFNALPNVEQRDVELKPIKGLMADPTAVPAGCAFADRCEYATARCFSEKPQKTYRTDAHYVVCHLYNEETVKSGGMIGRC